MREKQNTKVIDFMDSMSKIEWWPVPAVFQLSPNRQWARHESLERLPKKKQHIIVGEIFKHYGLLPLGGNFEWTYFGMQSEKWKLEENLLSPKETK